VTTGTQPEAAISGNWFLEFACVRSEVVGRTDWIVSSRSQSCGTRPAALRFKDNGFQAGEVWTNTFVSSRHVCPLRPASCREMAPKHVGSASQSCGLLASLVPRRLLVGCGSAAASPHRVRIPDGHLCPIRSMSGKDSMPWSYVDLRFLRVGFFAAGTVNAPPLMFAIAW